MQNKLIILCVAFGSMGCYSTSPSQWTSRTGRDVIEGRQTLRNGSRLHISGTLDSETLEISTADIQLCRVAEKGHTVIREGGLRDSYGWPAGLLGGGIAATGGYFLYDGAAMSQEETDRQGVEIRMAKVLGGLAALGTGAVLFGHCFYSINGCGPDVEMEYREQPGGPLYRWADSKKKDCASSSPHPSSTVPLEITAVFESSTSTLAWSKETDATGTLSLQIGNTVRRVAAHCGKAWIEIFSAASSKENTGVDDDPSAPSQRRDETVGYKIMIQPGPIQSPSLILDPAAQRIAQECADAKKQKCIGPRSGDIAQQCTEQCNREAGAEYCQMLLDAELSVPDLEEGERQDIRTRYDICVKNQGIDAAKTGECKKECINRTEQKACPRGW